MIKQTLIAAVATLAIAAGSLATAGAASAAGMDHPMGKSMNMHKHKMCKPVFKTIKVRGPHHQMVWKKIKTGERCMWVR
jgi:hypothetical protein